MNSRYTLFLSTMGTAVEEAIGFDTMTDDHASAVLALGSKGVNGAFKRIECMRFSILHDLERFIIIVAANFTLGHIVSFGR